MKTLRRWQIKPTDPYCLHLAADARLSQTDYYDDQIWEVSPGSGEAPALALQTRFGGRAGLVSIVPMLLYDGRSIYQAQAYSKLPQIIRFAPAYLCFEAAVTPFLGLQAEFWAMESHAVGIRFTLANNHTQAMTVGLDIISFVGLGNKEQAARVLPTFSNALSLGKIGNLQPAIALEQAKAEHEPPSGAKLRQSLTIEPQKTVRTRFVHVGLDDVKHSAALAQKWLNEDWGSAFDTLAISAQAVPDIETGNIDTDATIAFAYRELVQSYLKPTQHLPAASVVATREPGRGYNPNDKGWNGPSPTLTYLNALGAANINPQLAQGLIHNYIAVQQDDGWIDNKPGLGGQKQGILCMPLLARLAWSIFQYTEDSQFLRDIYPSLQKFFQRWLHPDLDKDGDGLPEWQHEAQTGYVFTPSFASWQAWSEGADIRTVEAPDLVTYLLSESKSLKEIAYFLRDEAGEQQFNTYIAHFESALEQLWNTELGRYAYRDRDTHHNTKRNDIVTDARAAEELLPAEKLDPPNRLVVHVSGGVNLQPRMTLRLDGYDINGQAVSETSTGEQFVWAGGRGVYTSDTVFSQIDRVTFTGLSRVYRVDIHTLDTNRLDISTLLPLWSASVPAEHAGVLYQLLTSQEHFWRTTGLCMNSAQDVNFDPSGANGSGGVWLFWLTLMGEALIENGDMKRACELVQHILDVQVQVLKKKKRFSEFYHSDKPEGLGESGNVSGIVPVHLLMRVLGIRIVSTNKVWVGGAFAWGKPVTIRQHGVTVERSDVVTKISFPNGIVKTITGSEWQEVTDTND